MPSCKTLVTALLFAAPLLLTACGEGWEVRPYHGTPYDGRTAGSGVEYVRANMMPSKGTDTKPVMPEVPKAAAPAPTPPAPPPAATPAPPVKDAAPLFNKSQEK